MSAACCSNLLNDFYLNNKLIDPRGIKIGGVYIDLKKITTSCYFVSTEDDHISLWQGTYQGMKIFNKNSVFVLGKSGHVAGVVNPPQNNKYGFWSNPDVGGLPDEWLKNAMYNEGSWWGHWDNWLNNHEITPPGPANPRLGNDEYPPVYSAPGRNVVS